MALNNLVLPAVPPVNGSNNLPRAIDKTGMPQVATQGDEI